MRNSLRSVHFAGVSVRKSSHEGNGAAKDDTRTQWSAKENSDLKPNTLGGMLWSLVIPSRVEPSELFHVPSNIIAPNTLIE